MTIIAPIPPMPPTAIGMPLPRRSSMFSLSRSPIHRIAELRRSTFRAAFAPASKNHACSLPVPDHEAGGVQRWGTGEPFEPVVQPWGGDPSSRRRRVFVMIGRSRLRPGLQLFGRCLMKTKVIAAAAVLGITALASWSPPANAAGCLKGALIGGLAGHFAGHGVLGAGAGCLVGRHYANRTPRTPMTQSQTRTVTRDYDTTLNRGTTLNRDTGLNRMVTR